jgi:hypothetical protein
MPAPRKPAMDVAIAAPIIPNNFSVYQVIMTLKIAAERYVNARNLFLFRAITIFKQKLCTKGMAFGIMHKMAIQ